MPDQRTRRNANTMARLEEQRLSRQDQRREPVVEAVVSERSSALPFGSFEDVIEYGRPHEVGDLIEQLLMFEQEHAPRLIGRGLIRMKETLPHGDWQDWLRAYWHKSERSAERYMRRARENVPVRLRAPKPTPPDEKVSDLPESAPQIIDVVPSSTSSAPDAHHCEYETRYRAIIAELKEGMSGTRSQLALLACINRALAIK